jgi:NitT/TauT family transport system substrate-binding protein
VGQYSAAIRYGITMTEMGLEVSYMRLLTQRAISCTSVLLALILLLSACQQQTAAPANPNQRATLKVGILPIGDLVPYFVAKERGFFNDEKLDISELTMPGGANIGPALESGDLQLGWSNVVTVAIANTQGSDWTLIMPGAYSEVNGHMEIQVMVPTGSPLQSAKDLEGKRVGVNTRANITELGVRAWATKAGADPDKFTFQEVPFPQMEQALVSGQLDAGMVIEPFLTRAQNAGSLRILQPADPWGAVAPKFMIASWFTKKSWADKNKDTLERFTRAMKKSHEWVKGNETEARKIFAQASKLDEDVALKMVLPTWPTTWAQGDIQPVIESSVQAKLLSKSVPVADIVYPGTGLGR